MIQSVILNKSIFCILQLTKWWHNCKSQNTISIKYCIFASKLSEKIEVSRPTLLQFLDYLDKARLIMQLHSKAKGMSAMNKPEKIYLQNTNLIHHISQDNSNIGNIRETFFMNQISETHKVSYTAQGDFLVDDKYTFEIGGKGKSQKQISGLENAFIVKDDIETGIMNIIPLWLFGFLF